MKTMDHEENTNETTMEDKELLRQFLQRGDGRVRGTAQAPAGATRPRQESQERTKNWSKEDYALVAKAGDELMKKSRRIWRSAPLLPKCRRSSPSITRASARSTNRTWKCTLMVNKGTIRCVIRAVRQRPTRIQQTMLAYVEKQKTG